jgi:anti-sigma-K factor RskA
MNQASAYDPRERAEELLISRALGTLDGDERIELEALLALDPSLDDDRFELVAASLDLALDGDEEPMPERVRSKVQHDADVFYGVHQQATIHPLPTRPRSASRSGQAGAWRALATAAVVLLLVWVGWSLQPGADETAPPGEVYSRTVASNDLVRWDWVGTEDPTVQDVSGDVVWSSSLQEGAMKIGGLAANDPGEFQYQLWIFDQERDERFPVDGGVFDVPSGSDEVIVPIRAKLDVDQPYLFAVTVEKPGGVVVSSRERIAILAQPPEQG